MPMFFRLAEKASKILTISIIAVCFIAFTSQAYAAETNFGKFKITTKQIGDEMMGIDIQTDAADITQGNDEYREISYDDILKDFPQPGMETLKVNLNTGGANCCAGYYLLSNGPDAIFAAYIMPYDGYCVYDENIKAFIANDASFMGYQLDPNELGSPFLSRAESPRLNRILVFENGVWRGDNIGEFPSYYDGLLAKATDNKELSGLAKNITIAYYSLMLGMDNKHAAKLLKKDLPSEYAKYADNIMSDLSKATKNFDFIQNIYLNTKE